MHMDDSLSPITDTMARVSAGYCSYSCCGCMQL
jgi:hypothetical protein